MRTAILKKPMGRGKKARRGVCCHYPGERAPRFLEPFLLLLLREKPAHGYELLSRLRAIGLEYEAEDIGHVYRNLRKLERLGFVSSRWEDPPGESRPRKRVYRITPKGLRRLDEWAESIRYIRENLGVFLKLYEEQKKGGQRS